MSHQGFTVSLGGHGVSRRIAVFFHGCSLWACLTELGAFYADHYLCGAVEPPRPVPGDTQIGQSCSVLGDDYNTLRCTPPTRTIS